PPQPRGGAEGRHDGLGARWIRLRARRLAPCAGAERRGTGESAGCGRAGGEMLWRQIRRCGPGSSLAARRAAHHLSPRRAQPPWPTTREVQGTVLDFSTSLRFHHRHIPGAWWVVRSRLDEARQKVGAADPLVLTSEDGVLAQLAAPEVQALWPHANVSVLQG